MCAYIASTLQLAEGADNVMLSAAATLNLGAGTENPDEQPAAAPAPAGPAGPVAVVERAALPDAPAAIRPGQAAPWPAGTRELPLDKLGAMFGGAL